MIRLTTIGPLSVHIGDKPVPANNEQLIAALFYLVVERARPTSRRTFAELFFPSADAESAAHSGRQLLYRLRKLGASIEGDQATIQIPDTAVSWDVETVLARDSATKIELQLLQHGYLADYQPAISDGFARWLDGHRDGITARLRSLLVRQLTATRARRDYRELEHTARACLALDPLNEEATLAAAESLVAVGAKADALQLLDDYLKDVGSLSPNLEVAPRLLRERIASYSGAAGNPAFPLVGRKEEVAALGALIDQSKNGSARGCLIVGPAGIGKTRLLDEVSANAAIAGHKVVLVQLHAEDAHRPFAVLRDLGPALLDLRGALGASPATLAAVRGLCGRGPSQYSRRPENAFDARAVAADIERRVIDLVAAVADETPLVIRVEDADRMDDASLALLARILDGGGQLCMLWASRTPIRLPHHIALRPTISELQLKPLTADDSRLFMHQLFAAQSKQPDNAFLETAVGLSGGVPLFLRLVVENYTDSGDSSGLPSTLSDLVRARLRQLHEPAKSVFDIVVLLGRLGTIDRIERVSQLPRYALSGALRDLEEQGFVQTVDGILEPSHDLLAETAHREMPQSVSRLLHRSVATLLESEPSSHVNALEIGAHWQGCGEEARAIAVIIGSARASAALGRPREAIALLERIAGWQIGADDRSAVDVALLEACFSAGEDHRGVAVAERLGVLRGKGSVEQQIMGLEMIVGAGRA